MPNTEPHGTATCENASYFVMAPPRAYASQRLVLPVGWERVRFMHAFLTCTYVNIAHDTGKWV